MADSPCMKNRSLKAGGRFNRWSFKAGFTVLLKRVGSFLSISYKETHFNASQPTSTIVRRLRVNPTTHDWLRLSWTCPWPSKICPSCESPINGLHCTVETKREYFSSRSSKKSREVQTERAIVYDNEELTQQLNKNNSPGLEKSFQ